MALEATRIAVTYMVPVIYLSDGYLANGAEPWNIPSVDDLPVIKVNNATDPEGFLPYQRDPETLARPWAIPGTPGLEHRLGGIEKQEGTGNVSYDPDNHQKMTELRAEKVARIARSIPDLEVHGDPEGDLLVLGWGSTYGSITSAVNRARGRGGRVSSAHLRHLNPFPANLEEVLGKFKKILIPELNMGQLLLLIRARFCIDAIGLNKVQGQPFQIGEIEQKIEELL